MFGNHVECLSVLGALALFVSRAGDTPAHQRLCSMGLCQADDEKWVSLSSLVLLPKLKGNGQNKGVPNLTHYQRTAKEPNFYEIYKKCKPALSYFNEELVV